MFPDTKNKRSVIDLVVNQDLCIGCGLCSVVDSNIQMGWNKYGFLVAQSKNTNLSSLSLKVCPFNPFPENPVKTEKELAELFLSDASQKHNRMGSFIGTYVGYSSQYREDSSSGGIATFVLTDLLDRGIISHVISVKESGENTTHYEYAVSSSKEEIINSSKTKYYPVTFADILKKVRDLDGKIAVTGVGCFIKAIRLLQHYNKFWKEKISFTVGIICGGVKSRFFTEYLASKTGLNHNEYNHPQFRVKDYQSTASDYSFSCTNDKGEEHSIKMRSVGDMWGTGMFKANACDFCEDVTTELADISLGDAWLQPYVKEGKGHNVIVTRSLLADKIICEAIQNGVLDVEPLELNQFLQSQQGSFNHRQKALRYRIQKARKKGLRIPPKRHNEEGISFDFKWVQNQRLLVRKLSLENWAQTKDSIKFDSLMYQSLDTLKKRTALNHYLRSVKRKLGL